MRDMQLWSHPGNYAGFSPDGDYLLLAAHRDSDTLSRSNWETVGRDMRALAAKHPFDEPEERAHDAFPGRGEVSPRSSGWVYVWSASCSMVGWIDYMMIRGDAPAGLVDKGHQIHHELEGYPVYDEDHFSQLEDTEACEYWESMSIRERMNVLIDAGYEGSIFAARRPYPPHDDNGGIQQTLIGY